MMILTDEIMRSYSVILWTNRARCTLNLDNLDLLTEESVSGACAEVELVYKLNEKSYCECLKRLSHSLKYD